MMKEISKIPNHFKLTAIGVFVNKWLFGSKLKD